jgi:arginine utilization protein RocB
MNDDSLTELEQQLSQARTAGAPSQLRAAVLSDVAGELRAARWDRRLARAAVVLLVVGVGLNAALVWQGGSTLEQPHRQLANDSAQDSLIQTAIAVAEATNTETAQTFARQLAALRGRELTDQEIATIAAANRDRG